MKASWFFSGLVLLVQLKEEKRKKMKGIYDAKAIPSK